MARVTAVVSWLPSKGCLRSGPVVHQFRERQSETLLKLEHGALASNEFEGCLRYWRCVDKFGKCPDMGLVELAVDAGLGALNDAAQENLKVDAVYVGNAASGQLWGMENLGPLVAERLGLLPCETQRIEATTASGSCAVKEAYREIAGSSA